MTNIEEQRFIITSFQRILREKRVQIVERELVEMKENNNSANHPLCKMRNTQFVDLQSNNFWVNKRSKKRPGRTRDHQNIVRKEGSIKIGASQMYDHKLSKIDKGNNVGMFYKGWGGKRKLHSSYKAHGTTMKNPKQCPNLKSIPS